MPGFLSPGDENNHQFVFSPNIDPKNEQETTEFSIKFDYDMDWATATAWMLYSDVEQYFVADGTSGAFGFFFGEATCNSSTAALAGFPVQQPTFIGPTPATSLYPPYSPTTRGGGQYQERNQEDISFEIRLTSNDDQRLRWLGGFYFLDIDREVGVAQTTDIGGAGENVRSFSDPTVEALVHDDFNTRVYSNFYGGRIKVEGAMFYTEIDDMQFFEFFVGPFGLLRVVTNVDEVAIVGGEIAGSAAVTENFTAFASGVVVNGEIEKHNLRPAAEGNEVPYAPKWTLNIGGDYVREVFEGIDFVGRVDYRITGDTWFHVLQDDRETADLFFGLPADFSNTKRTDFDVLNLRVGLEGDRWSVAGIVRNAMNQHIIEEVIPAPEFGGSFVHRGQKRTWAIEAQVRF